MTKEEIKNIIKKIIIDKTNSEIVIMDDDELFDCGVDSFSIIEIVVSLESYFEFEFEENHLSYKTLRSINSITAYVYNKLNN